MTLPDGMLLKESALILFPKLIVSNITILLRYCNAIILFTVDFILYCVLS